MADVNYDNIPSIIGIYEGTVASFEGIMNGTDTAKKQTFYGRLILITGNQTATDENAADRKQALWTSEDDGSNAHYLNMSDVATLKAQLAHIDGIAFPKSDGIAGYDKYDLTGGKGFIFKGSNGITVKIDPSTSTSIDGKPYWSIDVNGETLKNDLIGKTTDTKDSPTIAGAKKYADSLKASVIGDSNKDDLTSPTIAGAKKYTDTAKKTLEGTATDTEDSPTIAGAKKYADNVKAELLGSETDDLEDETIRGNANVIQQISDAFPVTLTSDNNGNYTLTQGGDTVGTISIPKELAGFKGSIVNGSWSEGNFTENENGVSTAIKFENTAGDIFYVDVTKLIDLYTAQQDAKEIQLAVSANNVISATIVDGAVSEAKIAANAVTTAKIKDGNVTKAKLESSVQTSLGKADSAIQSVTTTSSDYIEVTVPTGEGADSKHKVVNVKTSTMQQAATAELAGSTVAGVVPTQDIYDFLKARLSVKVVS